MLQLDGITVLCMAEQFPGPYATMLLADLGADVILVERFPGGDPSRRFEKYFAAMGRNKRSVLLDLKSDAGRESFLAMAARADVVLEGFRPGTVDRLGVGYEAVREVNPGIIYASISAYGQDGPYVTWPAHDLSAEGVAGVLSHVYRDVGVGEDVNPMLVSGDLSSALFAALAVTTALFARERTGRGDYIDIAMADCVVSLMGPAVLPAANGGTSEEVPGNLGVRSAEPCYGTFRAADGRCLTLSIAYEDNFWDRLCELIGEADLAGIGFRERSLRTAELRARLESALAREPAAHWLALFRAASIPSGPVLDLAEVPDDEQLRHRELFAPDPDGALALRHPVHFKSVGRGELRRGTPVLGADTRAVLESFGVDEEQIDAVLARIPVER
jgi:crotonobetainyl-CoA:carnitine CoA-transferase CaiB-like acyl-CoA transferase